jgi:hypothetical protein
MEVVQHPTKIKSYLVGRIDILIIIISISKDSVFSDNYTDKLYDLFHQIDSDMDRWNQLNLNRQIFEKRMNLQIFSFV